MAPPIDPVRMQRYFRDLKGLRAVDELVIIVTGGVPVNALASAADLEHGNHSSVIEHLSAIL